MVQYFYVTVHNILNPVKLVWLDLVEYFLRYKFPKFSAEIKKNKQKWIKKNGFALGSLAKVSKCITDRSSVHYSSESMTLQKTP
jgi:hypothetical protein